MGDEVEINERLALMQGMMDRLRGYEEEEEERPPLAEAQLDELRAILATYREGCRFEAGDMVTPRRGRALRGAGEPCLVLEVFDPPVRRQGTGQAGYFTELARLDMRIVRWITGDYCVFAAESWQYEEWREG